KGEDAAALVAKPSDVVKPSEVIVGASGKVVLEEFTYTAQPHPIVADLAEWLAANAFPGGTEYARWRERLPQQLVILDDVSCRDFLLLSTEVVTRVHLDYATKTVKPGMLWTEESLPPETLLYAPLYAADTRQNS